MNIDKYLKDGFLLSPYYSSRDIQNYNDVKLKTLTKDDIRTFLVGTMDEGSENLYSINELVLVKYESRYHIAPQDLIEKFEKELSNDELNYDDILTWSYFNNIKDNNGSVFIPILNDEYYKNENDSIEDYLFKKDDHIVSYVIWLIRNELREEFIKEDLLSYTNFIKDVLKNKLSEYENDYKEETILFFVKSLYHKASIGTKLPKKVEDFYKKYLLINADKGEKFSMRALGYEYYEGTNGFILDPNKALYWLEKYFKVTNDPDVARTIGYIYYYGRTTNGVPQGDKAFQYFAIGHIAGKYYEATYKLADCYLKGYGTPICQQAAYNLVSYIYVPTIREFLNGNDSKFADVALRLGNYYRDGIYVKKDLKEAHLYFLEAKVAIKKRLEHMEYIGDRNVAMAISNSLNKIEKELKIPERVVKDGGYIIKNSSFNFSNFLYEIEFKENKIYLIIKKQKSDDNLKYFINDACEIGFAERSEKIVFKMNPIDPESAKEFVEAINERPIKQILLDGNKIYALLEMEDGSEFPAFTTCDELIFYPQTIKDVSKKYTIVSVEFYPGSKLYDYLCLDEKVKIGDTKMIMARGERKRVTIKDIKCLYEDQLMLPYEKMAKIIS